MGVITRSYHYIYSLESLFKQSGIWEREERNGFFFRSCDSDSKWSLYSGRDKHADIITETHLAWSMELIHSLPRYYGSLI